MQKLDALFEQLNSVILGNPLATKLAIVCLLARGHLLIEDIPGVGKTTLSHAIANLLGLPYKRVQFTSDLLPTDIIGMTIFDMESKKFIFKKGPIFTSILLADEINRATPKTQSALLQAMEEQKVAVEGDAIINYLQSLISQTRSCGKFVTGLSPRAGLQWLQASKALAFVEGRDLVLPDDVKLLSEYTAAHRLHCNDGSESTLALAEIIDQTEVL